MQAPSLASFSILCPSFDRSIECVLNRKKGEASWLTADAFAFPSPFSGRSNESYEGLLLSREPADDSSTGVQGKGEAKGSKKIHRFFPSLLGAEISVHFFVFFETWLLCFLSRQLFDKQKNKQCRFIHIQIERRIQPLASFPLTNFFEFFIIFL